MTQPGAGPRGGSDLSVTLDVPPALIDAIAEQVSDRVAAQTDAASQAAERVSSEGRLALRVPDAAAALGISADSFERHVQPEIKLARCGSIRLIPVAELLAWLDRSAAYLGERA